MQVFRSLLCFSLFSSCDHSIIILWLFLFAFRLWPHILPPSSFLLLKSLHLHPPSFPLSFSAIHGLSKRVYQFRLNTKDPKPTSSLRRWLLETCLCLDIFSALNFFLSFVGFAHAWSSPLPHNTLPEKGKGGGSVEERNRCRGGQYGRVGDAPLQYLH